LEFENLLKLNTKDDVKYAAIVAGLPIDKALKYESGLRLIQTQIPMWIFHCLSWSYVLVFSENLSLIPLWVGKLFVYDVRLSVWN
jgi:hypothetical protein